MSASTYSTNSLQTEKTEVLYVHEEHTVTDTSSSEEPPMEEWSSLIMSNQCTFPYYKPKKILEDQDSYSPGSGEICAKYMAQSDSSVLRHPYYNYPGIHDPGIEHSLFDPPPQPPPYPNDGVKLYKDLCEEHNICLTRCFSNNLCNSEIDLSYYGLTYANVRCMAIALEKNRHVECFNLTDNYLNIDACYHLGKMIKVNKTLKVLILDGCRIREEGLQQLCNEIHCNKSLKTLSLAKNDLCDSGGERFANIIKEGINFNRLNLNYNRLGMKTTNAFQEALLLQNKFIYLDLSWNTFVDIESTANFLYTLALTSKYLVDLNLSRTGLENKDIAEAIAEVTLIPTLKVLDLSNNSFKDDCATILVSKAKYSTLQTFDLSSNLFTPTGACNILKPLLQSTVKLQNLYLDNICVNRNFIRILRKVNEMKCRSNFVITYDKVLHDWVAVGKDPRELILRRGEYMGRMKKQKKDVPMFLFSLGHVTDKLRAKELVVMMKDQKIPVNDDWVSGLIAAFPGPLIENKPTVNTVLMLEFMRRLWPELKLPPDWVPPVLIRVDVKRKKIIAKSISRLEIQKPKKKSNKKPSKKEKK